MKKYQLKFSLVLFLLMFFLFPFSQEVKAQYPPRAICAADFCRYTDIGSCASCTGGWTLRADGNKTPSLNFPSEVSAVTCGYTGTACSLGSKGCSDGEDCQEQQVWHCGIWCDTGEIVPIEECTAFGTTSTPCGAGPTAPSCNQSCDGSPPCRPGLSCIGGSCRNPSCSSETDCVCPILPVLPDCGHTCLNNGTASVGWPDCSCSNQTPASGYERIGTWDSSDCSSCTGYRQIGVSCNCTGWVAGSCGGGSCSSSERRYTRSCNPSGCSSEVNCSYDASCGGSPPTPTPQPPTPTPTPAPSCTIGYGPLTVAEGGTETLTANVYLQGGATGVNRVEFSSQNGGIATVAPSSDSSSPYTTDVTGVVEGSTNVTTTAYINPPGSCVENIPVIVIKPAAWFQTEGGHIYADANIDDNIPEGAEDRFGVPNRNLSLTQNSYPGIVAYNPSGSVDLGDGYPSSDTSYHWLASSSYQGKRFDTWSFFMRKYGDRIVENFDGSLPGADGIYYSASGKALSGNWDLPTNRWLIIMVDDDISIPVDITVPEGSFLAIVAQNNINFTGDVVQAQGMFIADNTIDTGVGDQQLDGEGVFAASNFTFSRDYDDDRNRTAPAEYFTFRPDFLISSFKDPDNNLWWFNSLWQELAP